MHTPGGPPDLSSAGQGAPIPDPLTTETTTSPVESAAEATSPQIPKTDPPPPSDPPPPQSLPSEPNATVRCEFSEAARAEVESLLTSLPPRMIWFARRCFSMNVQDAEDTVQTALMQWNEHLTDNPLSAAFALRSLWAIFRNRCLDFAKIRQRRGPTVPLPAELSYVDDRSAAEAKEVCDLVERRLPEWVVPVFRWMRAHGRRMSRREAAEFFGGPPHTAVLRYNCALKVIIDLLRQFGEGPDDDPGSDPPESPPPQLPPSPREAARQMLVHKRGSELARAIFDDLSNSTEPWTYDSLAAKYATDFEHIRELTLRVMEAAGKHNVSLAPGPMPTPPEPQKGGGA